jgi:hypothetical protein
MSALHHDHTEGLLESREPPCLSLYQPTHRHHPDNRQDPIRYRNLVKELEASLQQRYPEHESRERLAPFLALAEDREFWNGTLDGLAVLGAPGTFRVYRLPRTVAELAVVADTFHVKPLLRHLQSADRFQVLGLSRHDAKLFEGNRDGLSEVPLAEGVPRTITDALGDELTEPHQTVASYGGVGRGQGAMHHGHGAKAEEVDSDAERFFRAVDRAVLEHHSRPSSLPLILASLPEHHELFHRLSHNPFLVAESVDVHPDAVSLDDLRDRAWQVVEPAYRARLAELSDEFGSARAQGLASGDVAEVAKAVVEGRVARLLVEADREVPGRIDRATGAMAASDIDDPTVDDVLDDLAMLALQMGGDVVIVPTDRMPTDTGIAATYRY